MQIRSDHSGPELLFIYINISMYVCMMRLLDMDTGYGFIKDRGYEWIGRLLLGTQARTDACMYVRMNL